MGRNRERGGGLLGGPREGAHESKKKGRVVYVWDKVDEGVSSFGLRGVFLGRRLLHRMQSPRSLCGGMWQCEKLGREREGENVAGRL